MRRSRHDSSFASILSLFMPELLILSAKDLGFNSRALEFIKQRIRQGCGLGGWARPRAAETRAGG